MAEENKETVTPVVPPATGDAAPQAEAPASSQVDSPAAPTPEPVSASVEKVETSETVEPAPTLLQEFDAKQAADEKAEEAKAAEAVK